MLSILGLLLSTQQIAVLHLLGADDAHGEPSSDKMDVARYLPLMLTEVRRHHSPTGSRREVVEMKAWRPRWKMVFTWQCPIMFMSYAVSFYLAGLAIYVCTPLIRGHGWNAGSNVSLLSLVLLDRVHFPAWNILLMLQETAVLFLTIFAVAGGVFMFCSFWIYHYVDLEYESGQDITATEMNSFL